LGAAQTRAECLAKITTSFSIEFIPQSTFLNRLPEQQRPTVGNVLTFRPDLIGAAGQDFTRFLSESVVIQPAENPIAPLILSSNPSAIGPCSDYLLDIANTQVLPPFLPSPLSPLPSPHSESSPIYQYRILGEDPLTFSTPLARFGMKIIYSPM